MEERKEAWSPTYLCGLSSKAGLLGSIHPRVQSPRSRMKKEVWGHETRQPQTRTWPVWALSTAPHRTQQNQRMKEWELHLDPSHVPLYLGCTVQPVCPSFDICRRAVVYVLWDELGQELRWGSCKSDPWEWNSLCVAWGCLWETGRAVEKIRSAEVANRAKKEKMTGNRGSVKSACEWKEHSKIFNFLTLQLLQKGFRKDYILSH